MNEVSRYRADPEIVKDVDSGKVCLRIVRGTREILIPFKITSGVRHRSIWVYKPQVVEILGEIRGEVMMDGAKPLCRAALYAMFGRVLYCPDSRYLSDLQEVSGALSVRFHSNTRRNLGCEYGGDGMPEVRDDHE
jgi:hypothetical protein